MTLSVDEWKTEIGIAEANVEEQHNNVWEKTRDFYKGNHAPPGKNEEEFLSVNFIFSNITSQMPNLTYTSPDYNLVPEGMFTRIEELRSAKDKAELQEKILNKETGDLNFKRNLQLATLDSMLSLGILKVYHRTEMGKNPKAGQPMLNSDGSQKTDSDGNELTHPERIPVDVDFVMKRVQPENFLVDPRAGNFLSSASWVAEKNIIKTSDAQKKFNDSSIEADEHLDTDITGSTLDIDNRVTGIDQKDVQDEQLKMTTVYEVWNTKDNMRFYLIKGKNKKYKETEIPKEYQESCDGTPYVTIKHHEIPNKFYPIPDVFPATQINLNYDLARNQINNYRKQFVQKFWLQKGVVADDQLEKLQSGELGEVIETESNPNANPPARATQSPNVPQSVINSIELDIQDIRRVSGITQSQLGAADTGTQATQSLIAQQSSNSKMQWKLMNITDSMGKVGEKMLRLIQNRKVKTGFLPTPKSPDSDFIKFQKQDLSGDFEVNAEFGSTRPDDEATQQQKFQSAIQLIANVPQLLQHFDTKELAKLMAEHFPISKTALRAKPDPMAFQSQGGSGGVGGEGSRGAQPQAQQLQEMAGQSNASPQNSQQGNLQQLIQSIEGGTS